MKPFTVEEIRLLELLGASGWALSYKEMIEELSGIDGRVIWKMLESLTDNGWVGYGPSTYENGVSVRTWVITTDGKLALLGQQAKEQTNQPVIEEEEVKSTTKETAPAVDNSKLLNMFDDAVKVMRTAVEASLATPVYRGDLSEAVEAIKKYRKVAIAMDDHASKGYLDEVLNHLQELNGTATAG